jgi:hypothetical protein
MTLVAPVKHSLHGPFSVLKSQGLKPLSEAGGNRTHINGFSDRHLDQLGNCSKCKFLFTHGEPTNTGRSEDQTRTDIHLLIREALQPIQLHHYVNSFNLSSNTLNLSTALTLYSIPFLLFE